MQAIVCAKPSAIGYRLSAISYRLSAKVALPRVPTGQCVDLLGLSKSFPGRAGRPSKQAVDALSLTLYSGQVTDDRQRGLRSVCGTQSRLYMCVGFVCGT
jgi:hypothetical protein